ncbi:VOC family protein [Lewinella sp. 4G2]|uniref:VOC family protein n=1 Tax=Lewinella sp. 4G2 TaxID=1803372 RepID=UPI0007B46BF1|nr:VOC family protein [Lewinella sp. 4G2]OAV42929.1 hypothetical protein A3850_017045 [Lewinella sp. 4G2]
MIDHLVYVTHDLAATTALLEVALHVTFSDVGRHLNRGTMNRLLRIGPNTYLELLAADPSADPNLQPRWMGTDGLPVTTSGRLTRWAWAVTDGAILTGEDGQPITNQPFEAGSRTRADGSTLHWKLTDPGATPLISPQPFLIDWLGGSTPAHNLPDQGVVLQRLAVSGPNVSNLATLGGSAGLSFHNSSTANLTATLIGPQGQRVILT